MTRREHQISAARALVLLRLALGAVMLLSGAAKMTIHRVAGVLPLPLVGAEWQSILPSRISGWLANNPDGVASAVARDLILPNGALVAGLVAWVQLLAGVMLIAGFRTRWAALAAGAISASLAAAAAIRDGGELRGYLLLGIIALAVMLGDAGRTWGLDGWRSERRRDREL